MEQTEKQRTLTQNRALWKYFELLAKELNSAGMDIKKTLPEIDIPWSKQSVHDFLWIPVQETQLRISSTTQLTTTDIDIIYETVNRFVAEKGIHIPFPSLESLINKMQYENETQKTN